MQPPHMVDPQAQQNLAAAMMWQMQMGGGLQNPASMMGGGLQGLQSLQGLQGLQGLGMMPPWPPPMPMVPAQLSVRVDGLKFEYQLTEDDVRKVFSRYGGVSKVDVDREGTKATVSFDQPHQAMAAQHDLDRKQLAGMSGAFLRVEFQAPTYDPSMAMAAAGAMNPWASLPMGGMAGTSMAGYPTVPALGGQAMMPSSPGGHPKKYTCKLEVGIENEGEFRVGSRVIQIARQIWQDPKFQEFGGKTRLRGKGIGGPHEADEPLALCISCREQEAFDKAVNYAETQLAKVHADYKAFCLQKGRPVPELSVKVSKKGSNFFGGDQDASGGGDVPKGERPETAPTDEEIEELIEQRNEARKAANFKKADEVREYLKSRGVVLMDEKGAKGNFQGKEVTNWRFWRP
mmetsp:Transcript_91085/g.294136  ORF Transcript_91085/g.294136 Transcript_91085/m.294136 type:complete len:402 (-) Transcript_91085:503-1708(-)